MTIGTNEYMTGVVSGVVVMKYYWRTKTVIGPITSIVVTIKIESKLKKTYENSKRFRLP